MVMVFFLVNEMVQFSGNIETGRYFVRERGEKENKLTLGMALERVPVSF
jgi:hypothetical protein